MSSRPIGRRMRRGRSAIAVSALALLSATFPASVHSADPATAAGQPKTATPIKHVIVVIGENRSFDHVFATYKPKRQGEKVFNLLSEGIVNADGTPGYNFSKALQYKIASPPNNGNISSVRICKTSRSIHCCRRQTSTGYQRFQLSPSS